MQHNTVHNRQIYKTQPCSNDLCITQYSSTVYDTLAVRQGSYTFPRHILHDLEPCPVLSGEGRVETFDSMLLYRKVFKLNTSSQRTLREQNLKVYDR